MLSVKVSERGAVYSRTVEQYPYNTNYSSVSPFVLVKSARDIAPLY
jgi:hypothetical protein